MLYIFRCPIDKKNEHGNTPLHMACQNGLLIYFITFNLIYYISGFFFQFILGHKEIADYFVSLGCKVNEKNGKGNTALHFCAGLL